METEGSGGVSSQPGAFANLADPELQFSLLRGAEGTETQHGTAQVAHPRRPSSPKAGTPENHTFQCQLDLEIYPALPSPHHCTTRKIAQLLGAQ